MEVLPEVKVKSPILVVVALNESPLEVRPEVKVKSPIFVVVELKEVLLLRPEVKVESPSWSSRSYMATD